MLWHARCLYSRTTACGDISRVYGLSSLKLFLTLATLKNDDLQYQTMTESACHCLCSEGDYPVITFWGRLQPATIPSNLTGWFWTACDRMDCFLFPATRMGEKAVCEWGGEVVDDGFKSTSTVSTSLAVGELLQLMVQQPSALVVTGMLATIKTLWNWWRCQYKLIQIKLPVTLLSL